MNKIIKSAFIIILIIRQNYSKICYECEQYEKNKNNIKYIDIKPKILNDQLKELGIRYLKINKSNNGYTCEINIKIEKENIDTYSYDFIFNKYINFNEFFENHNYYQLVSNLVSIKKCKFYKINNNEMKIIIDFVIAQKFNQIIGNKINKTIKQPKLYLQTDIIIYNIRKEAVFNRCLKEYIEMIFINPKKYVGQFSKKTIEKNIYIFSLSKGFTENK